jgi:hypothetical protein
MGWIRSALVTAHDIEVEFITRADFSWRVASTADLITETVAVVFKN